MENNLQKNRKDKILKMVRNRIQEMKVETLKNENSAVRLWWSCIFTTEAYIKS